MLTANNFVDVGIYGIPEFHYTDLDFPCFFSTVDACHMPQTYGVALVGIGICRHILVVAGQYAWRG